MPDLPGARATIELRQVRALAIESKGDYKDPQSGSASGIEHWKVGQSSSAIAVGLGNSLL